MKKKLILLLILQVSIFVSTNIFAQASKITTEQTKALKTIKNSLCDCAKQTYRDFSPKFHKVIEKMAKKIRENKATSTEELQEYLKNNPDDTEKFKNISNQKNKECKNIDFDEDIDIGDEDEKEFLTKNFQTLINMMKQDKNCSMGLVSVMITINKNNKK